MKRPLLLVLATFLLLSPSFATIYGPSHLCYNGSTGTIAYVHGDSTIAGGGTWSSSDATVVSVSATTAATAIITAINTGTATLSYTGPSGLSTSLITVTTSGADSGIITGPSTVFVGSSIQLSNLTGPIGSWAPGLTGNVSTSTGSYYASQVCGVTGISVGTALITYFVPGCTPTPPMAVKNITVIPATDRISGKVSFPTGCSGMLAKVWLIKYDPSSHLLYAVDSNLATIYPDTVHYQFCGVGTDSFRVKAAVLPTGSTMGSALPTYYPSISYWNTATVIYHTSGVDDVNMNINMIAGTPTTGIGFVSGDVTLGANKGTASAIPARRMQIFCKDEATGNILQYTYTDDFGRYSFGDLPVDHTYAIYPEEIGYATTPFSSISLSTATPSMTNARFTQHTLSHTITPGSVSVRSTETHNAHVTVFPNPAGEILNIHMSGITEGIATYTLYDVTGRVVSGGQFHVSATDMIETVALDGLASGLYFLSFRTEQFSYTTKVEIK